MSPSLSMDRCPRDAVEHEPFLVDSTPGRVSPLGFRVLDGPQRDNSPQPAPVDIASARSGQPKWGLPCPSGKPA